MLWSEARRERAELGVALLGAGGALHDEWPLQLLEQFSGTIGGGTNEVHRTMIGERVLGLPAEPRVDRDVSVPRAGGASWLTSRRRTASTTSPIRCGANTTACTSSRASPTCGAGARSSDIGITTGWHCCDVGSGAGTVAAWMAEQVGASGRVLSLDVDTRFQPPSRGCDRGAPADVTTDPIGAAEFDVVHARAVLQHLAPREAVLDSMIAAAKPGGWVVVGDVDWIQFDAQQVPEPFATLSRTMRDLSTNQHGYDGTWGRRLVDAFSAAVLATSRAGARSGRCAAGPTRPSGTSPRSNARST